MGKEFKNIEDLFKSTFEDYRVEPSEKIWGNLDSKLKTRRFLHSDIAKFIGLSIIALAVSVIILNLNKAEKIHNQINQSEIKEPVKNIEPEKKESIKLINTKKKATKKNVSNKEKRNLPIENEAEKKTEHTKDYAPVIISKSLTVINNDEQNAEKEINLRAPAPPVPVFSIDKKEGCVPFTVKLHNISKSAVSYEWDFGDGNTSHEVSPQYTYRYPGVYKITLKAIGLGGAAISYIDSIVIHEPPETDIVWPYESEIFTGQKIQILNKSENINKVEWNFGDNQFSNEKNAKHVYKKKGSYDIKVKVWSKAGCVDSAVLNSIEVVDIEEKIVFPNAFTPNLDGPVSGYYDEINVYNDVFYPKYNGKIEQYELKIYSKYGVEVFRSNDINYGWNGYYNNRLMPEGVYVYIVRGMFEGNQKFLLKGDVTLLYRK